MVDLLSEVEKTYKYAKYKHICIIITALISIIMILHSSIPLKIMLLERLLPALSIIISCLTTFFGIRFKKAYQRFERGRREDEIDEIFSTGKADAATFSNYERNDIYGNLKKLIVDLHERCVYAGFIVEEMVAASEHKLIIGAVVFLFLAVGNFIGSQVVVAVVDLFFTMNILDKYWDMKNLQTEMENVQEECKIIAEKAMVNQWQIDKGVIVSMIRAYLRCETAFAHASILLDSKLYEKKRGEIAAIWERIEGRYYMTR